MKLLVADDDPISLRILTNYLTKWGYKFVTAGSGREAWQLLQQQDFPIVISDWLMPEMDGLELIRKVRDWHCPHGHIYTILLTAKSQKEDLVTAMEAGADDFLAKPFDRDELRVRLKEGERLVELDRSLARQANQITAHLAEARRTLQQVLESNVISDPDARAGLQQSRERLEQACRMAETLGREMGPTSPN